MKTNRIRVEVFCVYIITQRVYGEDKIRAVNLQEVFWGVWSIFCHVQSWHMALYLGVIPGGFERPYVMVEIIWFSRVQEKYPTHGTVSFYN